MEMSERYWFISYCATNYDHGRGLMSNDVTDKAPSQWVKWTYDMGLGDGPYVIMYAEEITKEQYLEFKEKLIYGVYHEMMCTECKHKESNSQ